MITEAIGLGSKISMSKAKDWMRCTSAPQLASRFGKITKARNTGCHPDTEFMRDLLLH